MPKNKQRSQGREGTQSQGHLTPESGLCAPLLRRCSKAWSEQASLRQNYFGLAFSEFSEIIGLRRSYFPPLSTVWESTPYQPLSSFPPWHLLRLTTAFYFTKLIKCTLSLSLTHTHTNTHIHTHRQEAQVFAQSHE